MKKRCYLLACLGMLLCTLLAPVTSVGAAVTWPTTSGYPAPPSFGDVDGLFSPTMGDSSLLTDPTSGHAVGLEINKDQANRSGAIWSKAPMFDLDKDSSYTMYFYMGNKPKSGEGMAFVLAAKPAAPTKVDTGSLGVWGLTIFRLIVSRKKSPIQRYPIVLPWWWIHKKMGQGIPAVMNN